MAGAHPDWRAIHDELAARDPESLTAAELDLLGESLFWLDRPDESIDVLGRAYTAHVAAGDHDAAAMAAWQLFYDHAFVGENAMASGWLERARRQVAHADGSAAEGFLAVAESDRAGWSGVVEDALGHAERAVALGEATGEANLLAMALQVKGRALIAAGDLDAGIVALDEAMIAVVNGELAPLFTGWVYCNALAAYHDIADLRRALQWSDAAMRWCAGLVDGRLYPGICRLHVVELQCLRGELQDAAVQAEAACADLASHDPRYAGDAHYLIGELHRLAGDLDLAEDAFTRAHQLGRVPQPGLARVRLSQGRIADATRSIEAALELVPAAPLRRIELLDALAEAHLAAGDIDAASGVVGHMAAVASAVGTDYLRALAATAEADVLLARGDAVAACRLAGVAAERFHGLGLRYDEARARAVRGAAARLLDDADTARLELDSALDLFRRVGAEPDVRRVAAVVAGKPSSPLSSRELDVLRLVARGGTNKDIAAELFVSEHTVARHLSNIYTKLGVGSRSAATAFGYEHSLI